MGPLGTQRVVGENVKCPGEAAMTPNQMVLEKMFDSLKVDAHRFSLIYYWISKFEHNATKEEIQTIFKLMCRVTELKTNLKGIYDSYECSLCGEEEETQAHILECPEIEKNNEDNTLLSIAVMVTPYFV